MKIKSLLIALLLFAAGVHAQTNVPIGLGWGWTDAPPTEATSTLIYGSTNLSAPMTNWLCLTNIAFPYIGDLASTNPVNGLVITQSVFQVITGATVQVGPGPRWFFTACNSNSQGISFFSNVAATNLAPPAPAYWLRVNH